MNASRRYAHQSNKVLNGWVCSTCQAKQRPSGRRSLRSPSKLRQPNNAPSTHVAGKEPPPQKTNLHTPNSGLKRSRNVRASFRMHQPFKDFLLTHYSQPQATTQRSVDDPFNFFWALRYGKPEQLVAAISNAIYDPHFLRGVPGATWSEVLRRLDPQRWVLRSSPQPRNMGTEALRKAAETASFERRRLSALLSEMVGLLKKAGVPLVSSDYRLLLQYGVQLQDRSLINRFWSDMKNEGLLPDLQCYNAKIQAVLIGTEPRLKYFEEPGQGHVAPEYTNLTAQVRQLHDEMVHAYAIEPNTESYCHLITACARDGTLSKIPDILHRVWNLNAEDIRADHATSHVSNIDPGHRLYPTTLLLHSITESFGYFGRMLSAFRLIDFISQHYSIPIKPRVTNSLLYWTSYHSRDEGREWKTQFIGVPPAFSKLPRMFSMLQSQNMAQLNGQTIHILFKNLRGQRATGREEVMRFINAGSSLFTSQTEIAKQTRRQLQKAETRTSGWIPSAKSLAKQQRLLEDAEIRAEITRGYLSNWLSDAIEQGVPNSLERTDDYEERLEEWRLRGVPNTVLRFQNVVPKRLRYQVPTGRVYIRVRGYNFDDATARASQAFNRTQQSRDIKNATDPFGSVDRQGLLLPAVQREIAPAAEIV